MQNSGQHVLAGLGVIEQTCHHQLFAADSGGVVLNGAGSLDGNGARGPQQHDHQRQADDEAAQNMRLDERGCASYHSSQCSPLEARQLHDNRAAAHTGVIGNLQSQR